VCAVQGKVADRDRQIQELSSKLAEHQAAYMAQHAADRAEIERLNNKLLDSGAASIAGLKATLQKAGAALAAAGDGKEEVSHPLSMRGSAKAGAGLIDIPGSSVAQTCMHVYCLQLIKRVYMSPAPATL
jgi:hypothetical protein